MLKQLLTKEFGLYLLFSVFVTFIDMSVSYFAEKIFILVVANTTGIVTGFVIQYVLTSKFVYHKQNKKAFFVFFGTFLFALVLANSIVVFSRTILFEGSEELYPFLISKGLSIAIPFFLNYFLRNKLMKDC